MMYPSIYFIYHHLYNYIYFKIAGNDTGFFPQEEARCFKGEEDTTGQKLDELQDKVEGILQRFKEKVNKICL